MKITDLAPAPYPRFLSVPGIFRRRHRCLSYLQSKARLQRESLNQMGPWMIRATAVLFGVLYLSLGKLAMEQTSDLSVLAKRRSNPVLRMQKAPR